MDNSTIKLHMKGEGFLGQKMVVIPSKLRRTIKNNPITENLYLTDIGYYPHAENHFRKRDNGAEEYILIYCLEGRGWIEMNSTIFEIIPNSYVIIPANLPHKYGAEEKKPWSIYWVHFRGKIADSIYRKYLNLELTERKIAHNIPFTDKRISYFEDIIALLEKGYSTDIIEYVNIRLSQLLGSFIYPHFHAKNNTTQNSSDVVNSVIQYMQMNLHSSLSIEELANHLNYSASHIYSLFKKGTGYTPISYFNHLKIQKACNYLSFTDKSIKEIAYKLGYNDPFYFSRTFKKLIELSPSEYRNKL